MTPTTCSNKASRAILAPLREKVKEQGLWACHLGPELGGQGFGQLKLALMNEILGRSHWAPTVFGTAAPDTGNAEILALYGTEEQKARYLQPLLEGNIVSTFSMTEPQGGSDPKEFVCKATRDGDEWVIDGREVVLVATPATPRSSSSWWSPTPTRSRTSGCRCSSSPRRRRGSRSSATSRP